MGGDELIGQVPDLFEIKLGGGVRVGLEDALYGTERSNVELVDAAVKAIQKAGSEPATTAEVRAELAAYKRPAA